MFIPVYLWRFFLAFRSCHYFNMWLSIELNLVAFLAIIKLSTHRRLEVNTIKYFLRQALGSILLVLGALARQVSPLAEHSEEVILISLLLKLGIFPFQEWLISISFTTSFRELWLISIPQKIIPIWFLIHVRTDRFIIGVSVGLGVVIRLLGGIRGNRRLTILAYSSLINTRWVAFLVLNVDSFCLFYLIYGTSLYLLMQNLASNNLLLGSPQVSQISWVSQLAIMAAFLNIAGVPPLLNIWRKGLLLKRLLCTNQLIPFLLFTSSRAGFLYIYLRFCLRLIRFRVKRVCWKTGWTKKISPGLLVYSSFLAFLF